MIKIGDFSKLAHVTVRTLHHYDEVGLLKPAHIDRFTGYRYYTLGQLSRLNRILALKDLGFSLDQVAQLIDEELSNAEIRGMLRMKQFELAETIELERARLARVESRLQQLERAGLQSNQEIAIKEVGPLVVLSARVVAASEAEIQPARVSLQRLLARNLDQARLKPAGPWFALLDQLPYTESDLEVELAVPIQPRANQRAGDWQGTPIRLRELPGTSSMASVIHEGAFNTINQAYTDLYAWAQQNAFKITGPCREVYLQETGMERMHPQDTRAGFIEVQCPVEQASIPISIYTSEENRKEKIMEPKYISLPALTVVGLSYIGKNENQEIPQLWDKFVPRMGEVKHITGNSSYGACFSQVEGAAEGEFEYVACYAVTDTSATPEGMVVRQIPAHKYAVFTHKGKLDSLGSTYQYIYETWVPQAGVELHPDCFDMERYDERFIPDSDESELDILIAIKE